MKVLTVDDNPMAGILLSDMLTDLGHKPLVAKSAKEAIPLFLREEPEVCILDWMMPGTDGLQLACSIRKHRHGAGAYIIMLSAKQDLDAISRAYSLGVDDFITKPVAAGEIKARLHIAGRLVALQQKDAERADEIASLTAELERLRAAA